MIKLQQINSGEKGLSVRAKLNTLFREIIDGAEGVNAIQSSLSKVSSELKELTGFTEDKYSELREQLLKSFDYTDISVADLLVYINGMNGGVSGFAVDTSFIPDFPLDKSVTVLAGQAGTYTHFLGEDGNPITVIETGVTIFYRGATSTYWKFKTIPVEVNIQKELTNALTSLLALGTPIWNDTFPVVRDGKVYSVTIASLPKAFRDSTLPGSVIEDSSIESSKLIDKTIGGSKIKDNTIESNHIVAGAIKDTHLASEVKLHLVGELALQDIDFTSDSIREYIRNGKQVIYRVRAQSYLVGLLFVYSDSMGRILTQVFQTHYDLLEHPDFSVHYDDKTFTYVRHYNYRAINSTIPQGTWGSWKLTGSSDFYQQVTDALRHTSLARFNGIIETGTSVDSTLDESVDFNVYYLASEKRFVARRKNSIVISVYRNWKTVDDYMDSTRTHILPDKIYVHGSQLFIWNTITENLEKISLTTSDIYEREGLLSLSQSEINSRMGVICNGILKYNIGSTLDGNYLRENANKEIVELVTIKNRVQTISPLKEGVLYKVGKEGITYIFDGEKAVILTAAEKGNTEIEDTALAELTEKVDKNTEKIATLNDERAVKFGEIVDITLPDKMILENSLQATALKRYVGNVHYHLYLGRFVELDEKIIPQLPDSDDEVDVDVNTRRMFGDVFSPTFPERWTFTDSNNASKEPTIDTTFGGVVLSPSRGGSCTLSRTFLHSSNIYTLKIKCNDFSKIVIKNAEGEGIYSIDTKNEPIKTTTVADNSGNEVIFGEYLFKIDLTDIAPSIFGETPQFSVEIIQNRTLGIVAQTIICSVDMYRGWLFTALGGKKPNYVQYKWIDAEYPYNESLIMSDGTVGPLVPRLGIFYIDQIGRRYITQIQISNDESSDTGRVLYEIPSIKSDVNNVPLSTIYSNSFTIKNLLNSYQSVDGNISYSNYEGTADEAADIELKKLGNAHHFIYDLEQRVFWRFNFMRNTWTKVTPTEGDYYLFLEDVLVNSGNELSVPGAKLMMCSLNPLTGVPNFSMVNIPVEEIDSNVTGMIDYILGDNGL